MEKKKAFLAASITGGREVLDTVKHIARLLEEAEYEILSAHNASDHPVRTFLEKTGDPTAVTYTSFREWDNRWIEETDIFVAEISTPSHGVDAEFEHCRLRPRLGLASAPILCLYHRGVERLSPMITGITQEEYKHIWIRPYKDHSELEMALSSFLMCLGK